MATHTARNSNILAAYQAQKQLSAMAQQDIAKANIFSALRKQRGEMIAAGVMPSAIPAFDENSNANDLFAAQTRMNGIQQARGMAVDPANRLTRDAATGKVMLPARSDTAAVPAAVTAPAGKPAASVSAPPLADREAETGLGAVDTGGASPLAGTLTPPAVNLPGGRTALESAMDKVPFSNGVSAAGATQTGAGMEMTVPSQSGPRKVLVNPTFDQNMHAATGGKWAGMSLAERASYLRSNPATGNEGEVTDTGKTAFNANGERTVQGVGGNYTEYDPRQNGILTRTPNGAGGFNIESKYGTGTSSDAQVPPLVHPADAAAVAAPVPAPATSVPVVAPAPGQASPVAGTPVAVTPGVSAPVVAPLPGQPSPVSGQPPSGPLVNPAFSIPPLPTGAQMLTAAQTAADAARANVSTKDAQFDATAADAAAAQKAKEIQAAPPPQTKQEYLDDTSRVTFPPLASNTSPTPLGSTSMQESPLTAFATSPADAQFKKRLTDGGDINDGVA